MWFEWMSDVAGRRILKSFEESRVEEFKEKQEETKERWSCWAPEMVGIHFGRGSSSIIQCPKSESQIWLFMGSTTPVLCGSDWAGPRLENSSLHFARNPEPPTHFFCPLWGRCLNCSYESFMSVEVASRERAEPRIERERRPFSTKNVFRSIFSFLFEGQVMKSGSDIHLPLLSSSSSHLSDPFMTFHLVPPSDQSFSCHPLMHFECCAI